MNATDLPETSYRMSDAGAESKSTFTAGLGAPTYLRSGLETAISEYRTALSHAVELRLQANTAAAARSQAGVYFTSSCD